MISQGFFDLAMSEKPENKMKKRFIYGFSMGGTVVIQLHRKDPTYWDGAVLLAPMCKVHILTSTNLWG
jgi:acylglycerol lipase